MTGTVLGGHKRAAARMGISLEAYEQHIQDGESWCWDCKTWRDAGLFYRRRGYLPDPSGQCVDCHRAYMRTYMRQRYASKRDAS